MENKNIDVVLCIDATADYGIFIDNIKKWAVTLYRQFAERQDKTAEGDLQLRVKVIAFRDYACDEVAMEESPFFILPEQDKEYKKYVDGIKAYGGGDLPENALEALALALKSDWTENGEHMIFLFTASEALPFGKRAGCPNYPEGMPADLNEFKLWWEGKSDKCSFKPEDSILQISAPDGYPWNEMQSWDRVYAKLTKI